MPVAAWIGALALPSLPVVFSHAGFFGVAVYLAIVVAAVSAGRRFLLPRFLDIVSDRAAPFLAAATLLILLAAVVIVHPLANSGVFGPGSDADDALDLGARALIRGEYPYYGRTYLGNPFSPLPGALLIAVPFVAAATSALQGVFWLAVFFLFVRHLLGDARIALLTMWIMVGLSPAVVHQLVVGTDYLANAIYVLIPATMLVRRRSLIWATLLGIALSSRANFVLLLPLVAGALAHSAGSARAVRLTAATALVFAAVTLPFFLFDPAGFSPLHNAQTKLTLFGFGLPFAGAAIPASGAVTAALLGFRRTSGEWPGFLRGAAIALAVPVAVVVALELANGPDLFPASLSYGVFALPFTIAASSAAGRRPPIRTG